MQIFNLKKRMKHEKSAYRTDLRETIKKTEKNRHSNKKSELIQ